MSALLLARQGVESIVVERSEYQPRAPKAHVLNPRSLEICRAAGLDVELMQREATAPSDDRWCVYMTTLVGKEIGRSPFEWHDDTYTPLPRINLAQPVFERILLDAIQGTPSIELRTGHTWTSAGEGSDVLTSTVTSPDGTRYSIDTPYLLAADGANSVVRSSIGVDMEGAADVSRCLTIHFEANLRALVRNRPAMFYWTVWGAIPGVFIAYDIDRTWVYLSFEAPETVPTREEAAQYVYRALGTAEIPIDVRHIVPWNLGGQVAMHYGSARTFLIGDAAHRLPPTGGLGLNTGIQDAHNLTWKLAAVLNGWADSALLATYETERRPIAILNAEQSLVNASHIAAVHALTEQSSEEEVKAAIDGMYDNFNSLGLQIGFSYSGHPRQGEVSTYVPSADIGDRMPHAWITTRDRGRISSLDLLDDRRFTVLTRSSTTPWSVDNGDLPLRVVRLQDDWQIPEAWLRVTGLADRDNAVLVRPDGHVEDRGPGSGGVLRLRLSGVGLALADGRGGPSADGETR